MWRAGTDSRGARADAAVAVPRRSTGVVREMRWAHMIPAEQDLATRDIAAPEGRPGLRNRYHRPAPKIPTPGAGLQPVPAAVAPPDGPLLLHRRQSGREPQPTPGGSAGMRRDALSSRHTAGEELRCMLLDLGLREYRQAQEVFHRSDPPRIDTRSPQPLLVQRDCGCAMLHERLQTLVPKRCHFLRSPLRPALAVCQQPLEGGAKPRSLNDTSLKTTAEVLQRDRQPAIDCFAIHLRSHAPPCSCAQCVPPTRSGA
jgi:hypothetical protein